jgi:Branched-chain amino acid transport system / permease component
MNTATTRIESPRGAAFEMRTAEPMRRFVDMLVRYASVALLLALIIVFSILSPQFLTNRNWQNLLVVQSVVTCMCFAATMPLIVGEFDLSLGSMIGFLAMFVAYLGEEGFTAEIVIPGMLIVGALVGLINGLLTVKLHISSFIATLGTGIVLSGVTLGMSNGQVLFSGIAKLLTTIGQGRWLGLGVSVWLTLVLALIMFFVLEHTPFLQTPLSDWRIGARGVPRGRPDWQNEDHGLCGRRLARRGWGYLRSWSDRRRKSVLRTELLLPAYAAAFLASRPIGRATIMFPGLWSQSSYWQSASTD